MKIRPTAVLIWLVLALAAAALYFALQPQPLEADFVQVSRGHLRITLDEEGETRVRDRYVVSAPLAGRVLRIEHEPGDRVRAASTVLARFRPTDPHLLDPRARAQAEAQVKTSESTLNRSRVELARAQSEREHAESELERHLKLHRDGLLAEDRLESARLRAATAAESERAAQSSVGVAQAELERARASLIEAVGAAATDKAVVLLRSPINGVVLRRIWESEAVVAAGEPLLELADPAKLEIVSDMLSTDAVKISLEDKVLIEQWGGERTLMGRVRRVEPYGFTKISALGVEEQRVNVVIDFDDPREAWDELGDGYRVEVRVVVWESDAVLKAPSSSLFRNGEAWAVYVVDDEARALLREVEIGQRNAREVQILAGLQEGDRVIAYPGDQIAAGIEVVAR